MREGLDRGGSPQGGRTRRTGEQGVVSAEEGIDYDEDFGPVIEEVVDLSQPLGEVWTDELPAYQVMEHEHRTVLHGEEYVLAEGIHTNQAVCLWSLIQPWLGKSRSFSNQGLEQAARTYGFFRSLNLTGAPLHGLINCVAVNVFR